MQVIKINQAIKINQVIKCHLITCNEPRGGEEVHLITLIRGYAHMDMYIWAVTFLFKLSRTCLSSVDWLRRGYTNKYVYKYITELNIHMYIYIYIYIYIYQIIESI